jgi:hypothetical protein
MSPPRLARSGASVGTWGLCASDRAGLENWTDHGLGPAWNGFGGVPRACARRFPREEAPIEDGRPLGP